MIRSTRPRTRTVELAECAEEHRSRREVCWEEIAVCGDAVIHPCRRQFQVVGDRGNFSGERRELRATGDRIGVRRRAIDDPQKHQGRAASDDDLGWKAESRTEGLEGAEEVIALHRINI